MPKISTKTFTDALLQIEKPKGKQLDFLNNHFKSPARATTAAVLAHSVGYKNWRPINLHYGKLAVKIGTQMGLTTARLDLLLDFAGPSTVSNENWILVMKPEFAEALEKAGWVQ